MKTQRGFIPILLILVIAALLGVGIVFLNKSNQAKTHAAYTYPEIRTMAASDKKQDVIEASATGKIAEGWIEYKNTLDGYSFLYPDTWHIRECSNGVYLGNISLSPYEIEKTECVSDRPPTKESTPVISLFVTSHKTVDEILKEANEQIIGFMDFIERSSEINGKNYRGMLIKLKIIPPWFVPSTTAVTTFIELPERNQVIDIGLVGPDDDSENANIYRRIISSFAFLPYDETATWQTYTNKTYKYSFKYPLEDNTSSTTDDSSITEISTPSFSIKITHIPTSDKKTRDYILDGVSAIQNCGELDENYSCSIQAVKNGILYEITYKGDQEKTEKILSTFKFTE